MYYIIKNNDTLPRIAARHYGDWTLWPLISDANRLAVREPLTAGRKIQIPYPLVNSTFHVVTESDTYHSLSQLYYGSEHFSNRIASANSYKVIYENIGERFTIPALASSGKIMTMGVLSGS